MDKDQKTIVVSITHSAGFCRKWKLGQEWPSYIYIRIGLQIRDKNGRILSDGWLWELERLTITFPLEPIFLWNTSKDYKRNYQSLNN